MFLTDNAVRAQLTALERDGLVRQSGLRPGRRKSNVVYELTAKAEHLFPKVYGLILLRLLDALKENLSAKKLDALVRTVGPQLAPSFRSVLPTARSRNRIQQAIAVLRELGGFCEQAEENGKIGLRCFDCPLAVAVVGHPEVCQLIETVLADVLGVPGPPALRNRSGAAMLLRNRNRRWLIGGSPEESAGPGVREPN